MTEAPLVPVIKRIQKCHDQISGMTAPRGLQSMMGMVAGSKDICRRNDSGKHFDGGQNGWFALHLTHEESLQAQRDGSVQAGVELQASSARQA